MGRLRTTIEGRLRGRTTGVAIHRAVVGRLRTTIEGRLRGRTTGVAIHRAIVGRLCATIEGRLGGRTTGVAIHRAVVGRRSRRTVGDQAIGRRSGRLTSSHSRWIEGPIGCRPARRLARSIGRSRSILAIAGELTDMSHQDGLHQVRIRVGLLHLLR